MASNAKMRINHSPTALLAGVDNLLLDNRKFDPSRDDIENICRFFSIGKLLHYEKEKGINVSHSNFFVFVVTSHGEYALKFYPKYAAQIITIEFALNRILAIHHFQTPNMYTCHGAQPFFTSNDLLATCYSYINGVPACHHIKQRNTIRQINAAMLSLKNILSTTKGHLPFLKQASQGPYAGMFLTTINNLVQESRLIAPYDPKKVIDTTLQDACQTYQRHQLLFTRQWLHNNANLTNFLIYKKTIYTLDLSHVQEDYVLSDLASLVISCLFLDITKTTIKAIVKDYFTQHKIKSEHFLVLNTLVKIGLIKEYLKIIRREKSIELPTYPPDLVRTYLFHSSARKKSITALLKKMVDSARFIV